MATSQGVSPREATGESPAASATAAAFARRHLLRQASRLWCPRALFLLSALCSNLLDVLADYPRGRSRGGSAHARQQHRVSRATSVFSFFGTAPSAESLVTALFLAAGFAALLLLIRRPAAQSSSGTNAGTGGSAEENKDDSSVFRPCASICLNEILLKRSPGGKFVMEEAAIAPFLSLCSWSKLFVFAQVNSDEEEQQVLDELEGIQAFDRGLQRHRVMFSSTRNGRASMVRQLQPLTHIDADDFIAVTLEGKVPNVVFLQEPLKECVDVLQAALQRPVTA
ncbi:conserved hypothetical protein [Neospora caninum Liverpool]|uniref:Transmembrane protein n=1 Tax=Neospora caninum (strain Liverpool) TaxID=572307 RepID=F0VB26_NEOCL|nr:conserved hypothetical protein [Neospora caninum Liverpool]CBZ50848.1 conserved hypothetical protein [Neospora caninum Liverpool]CEL68150.1 TPA: hypothetical protein BN1204_039230 [Neospora caninum Liverpool]|eukprot:XP_003880881.1 conserved hypothetical protein [Neospora caninum Liverpool]